MSDRSPSGYVLKLWFFTIVTGSLIVDLDLTISSSDPEEISSVLIFFITIFLLGKVFSIPTFLVCLIVSYHTSRVSNTIVGTKIILISVALCGMYLTLYLMGMNEYSIHFAVPLVLWGMFFKIPE